MSGCSPPPWPWDCSLARRLSSFTTRVSASPSARWRRPPSLPARPAESTSPPSTHGGSALSGRLVVAVLALLSAAGSGPCITRTGRHAGDWEMVPYRLDQRRRPVEAVYAQRAGAERCGWDAVERRDGRPVVHVARGSHASYLRAGVRDRMWPHPNDETDGRGSLVRPRVSASRRVRPRGCAGRSVGAARGPGGGFPGSRTHRAGPDSSPKDDGRTLTPGPTRRTIVAGTATRSTSAMTASLRSASPLPAALSAWARLRSADVRDAVAPRPTVRWRSPAANDRKG